MIDYVRGYGDGDGYGFGSGDGFGVGFGDSSRTSKISRKSRDVKLRELFGVDDED